MRIENYDLQQDCVEVAVRMHRRYIDDVYIRSLTKGFKKTTIEIPDGFSKEVFITSKDVEELNTTLEWLFNADKQGPKPHKTESSYTPFRIGAYEVIQEWGAKTPLPWEEWGED